MLIFISYFTYNTCDLRYDRDSQLMINRMGSESLGHHWQTYDGQNISNVRKKTTEIIIHLYLRPGHILFSAKNLLFPWHVQILPTFFEGESCFGKNYFYDKPETSATLVLEDIDQRAPKNHYYGHMSSSALCCRSSNLWTAQTLTWLNNTP